MLQSQFCVYDRCYDQTVINLDFPLMYLLLPHLCFRHKNCWMPWMSKQFLLECCPCLSMLFFMFSSLLDSIDTFSWKSSITFCFSFLSFSNFSNLFSEYLFLKTPLDSCFETSNVCVIYPNSMIYFPVQLCIMPISFRS